MGAKSSLLLDGLIGRVQNKEKLEGIVEKKKKRLE
jgi:hypothetical protein